MLYTAALTLIAGAATLASAAPVDTAAQTGGLMLPSNIFGLPFGAQCQGAVIQAVTNSSFGQCFPLSDLAPLLTGNDSIIPPLDMFMSDLCYKQPCSNETLMAAAQSLTAGCASDLATAGLANTTVFAAFSTYPVLREVLCLKTSDPYTSESYGGFLGEAPIPVTAYNSTDGTFCVSSFLTQYSAYLGANITVPYLATALAGVNQTAAALIASTKANVLCNNCLFGAVDIIASAFPVITQIPLSTILGYFKMSVDSTIGAATIPQVMDGTCAYKPLMVNTTTLPANITVSIVNSTFMPALMEQSM